MAICQEKQSECQQDVCMQENVMSDSRVEETLGKMILGLCLHTWLRLTPLSVEFLILGISKATKLF